MHIYIYICIKHFKKSLWIWERVQGHNGGTGGEKRGIHENYENAILLYEIIKNKIN